jgi:hypothetical protein
MSEFVLTPAAEGDLLKILDTSKAIIRAPF